MSLSVVDAGRALPHAEALVCDGERSTFSQLALRVQARLAQFEALGVRPLDPRPVALVVDGSLAMFECLYLCLELGVPFVPLNPRLTAPERALLVSVSDARCTIDPRTLGSVDASSSPHWDFPAVPDAHPLAWVPSSGSTGRPKLVELSRRAFLALCHADAERVPPSPTIARCCACPCLTSAVCPCCCARSPRDAVVSPFVPEAAGFWPRCPSSPSAWWQSGSPCSHWFPPYSRACCVKRQISRRKHRCARSCSVVRLARRSCSPERVSARCPC